MIRVLLLVLLFGFNTKADEFSYGVIVDNKSTYIKIDSADSGVGVWVGNNNAKVLAGLHESGIKTSLVLDFLEVEYTIDYDKSFIDGEMKRATKMDWFLVARYENFNFRFNEKSISLILAF